MTIKRLHILFIFSAGFILFALPASAQTNDPLNVGLTYFRAAPQENGIRLDWATETELNTAGFVIQRSPGTSDAFVPLDDIGFVSGQGGVATGFVYSEVDETAVYGQTYTYKLVEVETNSNQIDLETVTLAFIIVPTATPIVIGGGDNPTAVPTQTPPPTSTPLPTATPPAPTATNSDTAVSPTATPISSSPNTATPTPLPTATDNVGAGVVATTAIQPTATPQAVAIAATPADSSGSPVVFAQEPGYPPPDTPAPLPTEEAYPGGRPLPTIQANPAPITADNGVQPPTRAVIGGQNGEGTVANSAYPSDAAASNDAARGRLFLWTGFILALLIFIGGVIGSIALYRRKRE